MKVKSIFTDGFIMKFLDYYKFKHKSDDDHIQMTLQVLQKMQSGYGVAKEYDILGRKSKRVYLKSSGYYFKNLSFLEGKNTFPEVDKVQLFNKTDIDNYYNSTVYLNEHFTINKDLSFFKKNLVFLPDFGSASPHKQILFLLMQYRIGKKGIAEIENFISTQLDKKLYQFLQENTFEENRRLGSSHEFGYWLNYLLDFYIESENNLLKLNNYFEKLHRIFVQKKMYYHDVIGVEKNCINVSGILLISKAFLRYSIHTRDFRYANNALYLIDFVKSLQLRNNGFIQNTFPIYRGNSKFKFPSWTPNYFLEVLQLKKQAINEFKNRLTD